jgi:hypothetical protein
MAVATRSPRGRNLRWAKASVVFAGLYQRRSRPASVCRFSESVLTDSAANLLERVPRRQALERGADLRTRTYPQVRGPKVNRLDLLLSRLQRVRTSTIELRIEAQNALNKPQF